MSDDVGPLGLLPHLTDAELAVLGTAVDELVANRQRRLRNISGSTPRAKIRTDEFRQQVSVARSLATAIAEARQQIVVLRKGPMFDPPEVLTP